MSPNYEMLAKAIEKEPFLIDGQLKYGDNVCSVGALSKYLGFWGKYVEYGKIKFLESDSKSARLAKERLIRKINKSGFYAVEKRGDFTYQIVAREQSRLNQIVNQNDGKFETGGARKERMLKWAKCMARNGQGETP